MLRREMGMASNPEFVQYVCDQMRGAGNITYKKMFGEYGIYCNGKIIGLVCDNQFFLKPTEGGKKVLGAVIEEPPYEGAKPYFKIDEIDDRELLETAAKATYDELPEPKPKKRKSG